MFTNLTTLEEKSITATGTYLPGSVGRYGDFPPDSRNSR